MTLRALIFDVDGTLAETEEAHRRAFNETFAENGLNWEWSISDYTRLLRTTGGKERMQRHRADEGLSAPSDADVAALHKIKTQLYADILAEGSLTLREGVADLIDTARAAGLKIAVATTTNRPNVDALARCCWGEDASAIFDVIAAGDEVEAKKPAPDVFELALDRLDLDPVHCIAFEDSQNGLYSAKAAGLPVIVTPSIYTEADDFTKADWIVPTLRRDDLPPELSKRLYRF